VFTERRGLPPTKPSRAFEQVDSVDFGGEAITASLVATGGTLYVRSYDALYAIKAP
jgi:hypothetical protein